MAPDERRFSHRVASWVQDTASKGVVNNISRVHIRPVTLPVQLSDFLRRQVFVAFDTETTGLWAPFHRLVELAGIRFRLGSPETVNFHSLVNPDRPMPEEVIAVHGITDNMVADAPTARPVLEQFMEFCGNESLLVAHNAMFDVSFISCELDRSGLVCPDLQVLDTVDISRRLFPGLDCYTLEFLARHFGIAESQEHRALADADLVRHLFVKLAGHFGEIACREELTGKFTTLLMSKWPGLVGQLPPEFAEMNRALENGRRVEIAYRSRGRPVESRVIRLRQVYAVGLELYINAFCERAQAERTFRLDRIERFTVLD